MPAATAAALRQRLLEAFPPDRPYRRADLAAEPMPPIVAHYLEHLLDERLRSHAHAALRGPFDADSAAVRAVRTSFLRALYTAAQFHTEEWEAALSEAADRSVAYLLRPARVLAAAVFERQRGTLPLKAVLKRMERFAGHGYFVEGVANYAAEPDTEPDIDDIGFAKLLVQIDTYVAERRSARGWVESARPFLALGRLFPETPGLASRLLQTFFDPRLPEVARRLEAERYGLDDARLFALLTDAGVPPEPLGDEPFSDEAEPVTADALPDGPAVESISFQLVQDFELADDPEPLEATAEVEEWPAPDETPSATPDGQEPEPPKDEAPAERPALTLVTAPQGEAAKPEGADEADAAPTDHAATPEDAKAALEGDAVPLWQRFAKEPGSEAPVPPAAESAAAEPPAAGTDGVWPPHAQPAGPAEKKKAAPLWRQFVQGKEAPEDGNALVEAEARAESAPSPEPRPVGAAAAALASAPAASRPAPGTPPAGKPLSPKSLDALERDVLGPRASEKRSWFVTELFGHDDDAYTAVLRRLERVDTWDEAWRVIGAEVFRKHRVNIYGPAAVAFTDAVEARHKQRAADEA